MLTTAKQCVDFVVVGFGGLEGQDSLVTKVLHSSMVITNRVGGQRMVWVRAVNLEWKTSNIQGFCEAWKEGDAAHVVSSQSSQMWCWTAQIIWTVCWTYDIQLSNIWWERTCSGCANEFAPSQYKSCSSAHNFVYICAMHSILPMGYRKWGGLLPPMFDTSHWHQIKLQKT